VPRKAAPNTKAATNKKATNKTTTTKKAKGKATAMDVVDEMFAKDKKKLKSLQEAEVQLDTTLLKKPIPHRSTGSIVFNYAIGGSKNVFGVPACPGIPKAKITNVYGPEASGKTTFALTCCAQACQTGGTAVFIDLENEVVPSYAKALGVPIEKKRQFRLYQPETLDEAIKLAAMYAAAGVDIIVIDSVGAGIPQAAIEAEEKNKKTQLGLIATIWSQKLPRLKRIIKKTGTSIIGIAQLRSSMGQGASTVQGGRVWKYYSAVRMNFSVKEQEKGKVYNAVENKYEEQVIGAECEVRLDKCKVSDHQKHKYRYFLRWGVGIDDFRSYLHVAQNHKAIEKSGSWFNWEQPDGTILRAQGYEKFRQLVIDTPGAVERLVELTVTLLERGAGHIASDEEIDDFMEVEDLLASTGEEADVDDILAAAEKAVGGKEDFDE